MSCLRNLVFKQMSYLLPVDYWPGVVLMAEGVYEVAMLSRTSSFLAKFVRMHWGAVLAQQPVRLGDLQSLISYKPQHDEVEHLETGRPITIVEADRKRNYHDICVLQLLLRKFACDPSIPMFNLAHVADLFLMMISPRLAGRDSGRFWRGRREGHLLPGQAEQLRNALFHACLPAGLGLELGSCWLSVLQLIPMYVCNCNCIFAQF